MNPAASLALAVTLGFSSAAGAVELSTSGAGQVLIYPLYSVESGNDTAIHVTNASMTPTVAKVRILEGLEGRVVHSFNLYLGSHDVWTGVLTRSDSGARLVSADSSCTLPQLPAEGVELAGATDPGLAARARVGSIEVIGMAGNWASVPSLPPQMGSAPVMGIPCDALRDAFGEGGVWAQDSNAGLYPPANGLSGSVTLTNVMNGHQIALDATALLDFSQNARQTRPENPEPTLGQSETTYAAMRDAVLPFRNGTEAVTALLTHQSADGDYAYGAGLNAETDWVITFPTKAYLNAVPDASLHSPFSVTPGPAGTTCEATQPWYRSREALLSADHTIDLCGITNVIGIGTSNILGGQYVRTQLAVPLYSAGWMSLWFWPPGSGIMAPPSPLRNLAVSSGAAPFSLQGLGMIGFSIIRIQNGDVDGLLSNYVSVKRLTSPAGH